MNCEIHQLSPLRVSPADAADALRAVLHTILFARTLGAVRPREATCASSGARYVTCGDAGVERLVEDRLDALLAWIRKRDDALLLAAPDDPTTHHQLTLGFYERSEGEWRWPGEKPRRSRGILRRRRRRLATRFLLVRRRNPRPRVLGAVARAVGVRPAVARRRDRGGARGAKEGAL